MAIKFETSPAVRFLVGSRVSVEDRENLLENGNFEGVDGSWWTAARLGSHEIEKVNPLEGSKSLKLTSSVSDWELSFQSDSSNPFRSYGKSSFRLFPAQKGDRFEALSLGRGFASLGIEVVLLQYDQDNNQLSYGRLTDHRNPNGSEELGFFEITDPLTTQAAVAVRVQDDSNAPRDFFIDSIIFRRARKFTTVRLDETKIVSGSWESPQLNRGGTLVHRLVKLFIQYSSDLDTTVDIQFTPDGGRRWTNPRAIRLQNTGESVQEALVSAQITGSDVRFRLILNEDLVSIFGYRTEQYPANELRVLGD